MGQVFSFIFGCLHGKKNEEPRPNHEDYLPLQSCYGNLIEEHNRNKVAALAALAFHRRQHVVSLSQPQQQQQLIDEAALNPLMEVDLHHPLITSNSVVANTTTGVKWTKGKNEKPGPNHEEYNPLPSYSINIIEEHNHNKPKVGFHRHQPVVSISPQRHQQTALNPLAEIDLHRPLVPSNSIVANTAGVKEIKELIIKAPFEEVASTKMSKKKNKKKKGRRNDEVVERKIGPYASTQKILLVGEGDFSFSAALYVSFDNATNIVSPSLNDKDFLENNYNKSRSNIKKLESRGALVIHELDATKMAKHKSLMGMKFDRIIFNFPHSGAFHPTASHLRKNQKLVSGFIRNAKEMMKQDGEIHVTHKTSPDFIKWNILLQASVEGLYLIEESPFCHKVYPGYKTKYGFGGDRYFYCYPCSSYKFGLCGAQRGS